MKVAIINGSPKAGESASRVFADLLLAQLSGQAESLRLDWPKAGLPLQAEELAACEALVFVFPLYVDGIPSQLLRMLQHLEGMLAALAGAKPKVYAIVNCGFCEGDQARLALEMMAHWSARAGLSWGLGVGIGAGPMLASLQVPLGQGPRKNLGAGYQVLVEAILSGKSGEDCFYTANFPRRLYIAAAHWGWAREGKRNGLKRRDLYRRADV